MKKYCWMAMGVALFALTCAAQDAGKAIYPMYVESQMQGGAAQSAGIMHTDVAAMNIDALTTSTQKGLLADYGMGFLYVRREWAEKMQPAYLARFGVDLGDAAFDRVLANEALDEDGLLLADAMGAVDRLVLDGGRGHTHHAAELPANSQT